MYKRLLVAALPLFLGACASVSELHNKVEAKTACCVSMSEFKYEALEPNNPISFLLNEQAPVFPFETGKSYFKAFSLSTKSHGKILKVSSQPTGSIGFESQKYSQSFCARALFLDETYKQVSASDSVPKYVSGFWSSAFVSQFDIPINAHYVVLLTNPKIFITQSSVRYTRGGSYMVGNTIVSERGGEAIYHPCGPVADATAEIM